MKKIVYHGSPDGNIEVLTPHKSTHKKECIYATNDLCVALLYMGKGNGDLDTKVSTRDGQLELVERREGILESLYDKEGYLYELDGSLFNHYDYLWSKEVISFVKEIKPINKIYYPNVLKALMDNEQKGHITIYRYPNRPENVPLDNSDLIDKYINYERNGLTGAINEMLDIYPEFKEVVREKGYNVDENKTL